MQASNTIQPKVFNASDYRIGIVVADFNTDITMGMLQEAQAVLKKYNVPNNNVTIIHVPGSVEIPLVLQKMAQMQKFHGLVALGAIIKGESAHFDYVAKFVTEGVLRVQLDCSIPVGFGVLTTFSHDQASSRLHVGADAVLATLEVIHRTKQLS